MKKYLLFLIILFIFSYIYLIITKPSICTVRDSFHYRLGDVVKHKGFNKKWIQRKIYEYLYNDTIAYEYMLKTKNIEEFPNYEILFSIVKERSKNFSVPKERELIIHLRLGDVINWRYSGDIDELLEGEKKYNYLRNYKYYLEKLEKLEKSKIDKIILVGGYHTKENNLRSEEYLMKIKKYIINKGFTVETRINEFSADEDFIYMCNSKYFLKSGGGYSEIINQMVKINNNIVLDDS